MMRFYLGYVAPIAVTILTNYFNDAFVFKMTFLV